MARRSLLVLIALMGFAPNAHAAPTPAQLCESAMELASGKYAQCRLTAESKYTKSGDAAKRAAALSKCDQNSYLAFLKPSIKYMPFCPATEAHSAFVEYLTQCADDAAAAAAGASLPDYVGDLASCNADLGTCQGDLAACEALPPAPLLKTGETSGFGVGSDGDLQKGVTRGFVDNGDGTITDTATGLRWEKKSDDGSIHDKDNIYTWGLTDPFNTMNGTVSTTFLAALNAGGGFAGYTDWRLPNLTELESIRSLQSVNPAVFAPFNTNCGASSSGNLGCTVTTCSCTVPDPYWSSSTYHFDSQAAWFVGFFDGVPSAVSKRLYAYHVRAVRGGS